MKILAAADVEVGDEVVLGHVVDEGKGFAPCRHNSQNNPKHPCRTKVIRVGTKIIEIEASGYKSISVYKAGSIWAIATVEEARKGQEYYMRNTIGRKDFVSNI